MNILLIAQQTSVSETVKTMLQSKAGWSTTNIQSPSDASSISADSPSKSISWDIIIANLADFSTAPTQLIHKVRNIFPSTPLLVMYSYSQKILITPLLKAGANGYLQNGIPEQGLIEAVSAVAAGKERIIAESTY